MLLHVWGPAPNPRRVRVFLAEKGISVPVEDQAGDGLALRDDYGSRYPFGMVPMLELDDGTQIGESMAICRYFETLHPDPPLMGVDAKDRAIVEMWEHRAYDEGMIGAAECLRNGHPLFKDRGLPGYSQPIAQIPTLALRGHQRLAYFFQMFEWQLEEREFVASDRFTVADITTLCVVDFARVMADSPIPGECVNLKRWYEVVCARPSARA